MFAFGLPVALWLNYFSFVISIPLEIANIPAKEELAEEPVNWERIVGGEEADIEDYPYQVSYLINDTYFCGGFIISQDYILTAAHCAQNVGPSDLVVRAGSSWRQNGTIIPLAEVMTHPEYDDRPFDKDVAILKTERPIEFDDTMQPIALPPKNRPMVADSEVSVSGWGTTEYGATTIPDRLRSVKIPVLRNAECLLASLTVFTSNMWCAGNFILGGKGPCQGDSGGAAVQDGMAVGIVSFGRGCGQSLAPSVFADIAAAPIRDFIEENTNL